MFGESYLYLLYFVPSYCSTIYVSVSPLESSLNSCSSLSGLTVDLIEAACMALKDMVDHLHTSTVLSIEQKMVQKC